MKYIEAVLVTLVCGIMMLPFVIVCAIVAFLVEIVSTICEIFNDVRYEKGAVTDTFRWYFKFLRDCYVGFIK